MVFATTISIPSSVDLMEETAAYPLFMDMVTFVTFASVWKRVKNDLSTKYWNIIVAMSTRLVCEIPLIFQLSIVSITRIN